MDNKKKNTKALYWALIAVFAIVFLVSGGIVLNYFMESQEHQEMMEKTLDCVECYECVDKCPYELEIPRLLKENYEDYQNVLSGKTKGVRNETMY